MPPYGPGLRRVAAIRNSAYPRLVRSLSERDASAALAFVSELRALDDPLPFPPRILATLQKLIPSDALGYSELDPLHQLPRLHVWRYPGGIDEVTWGEEWSDWKDWWDLWWATRHTHPVCGYRTRTGDWTTAFRVSDFATLREFRRTPIYDAFYRGSIDHWLDVGLPATPTRTRVFIFLRHKRSDFDERDRLLADLLQPHLNERAETAEAALLGAAALAAVEEGATDDAGGVVLCSREGVIEYASPSSRALLKRFLDIDNGRVPAVVLRRSTLALNQGDRRLDVRIAHTGDLHVLMLNQHDTRIERLTPRERHVLNQIALGKENNEVALALGIAPATVAKHLEHIYRKLGVPNRTAAAAQLERD
jgi:DNA-binding CsgD family transcriptional regulator